MANAKVPRIFGRQVLSAAICARKPNNKIQELPVKLTLGHGDCEVYSEDWSKCFHTFQVADGKVEQEADGLIHFTYTRTTQGQQQNNEFLIKYDRFDLINNVFNPSGEGRRGGDAGSMTIVDYNDVIQFACEAQTQQNVDKFRQYLEAQAKKRVLFLASSTEISQSLLSAIAVEFRMRFPQIEQENWTEAFEVLWFEFVAFCVSLWTQCLKAAIEPHTGPNSFEYFRRLAASIAALIAKGADVFQVDRREFLLAVRKFLDTGDPSDIPSASRAIVADVELALGNVRKRWLLQLTDLFEFTQLFSVSIAIGQAVARETKELKTLTDMLSAWALGLVNNLTRGPRIIDFRNGVEKLSVAVLQATDNQRYSPEFHCTLALWKLSELVKASD
ncbi:hypothetical protein TRFO_40505 [Tritrichomonas foetus]|uniref:Uncharacterized protein n=1 Tax=Tritrichomonas foetus TaxID=1144522 RepID=A0A1J4J1C5_9EUKA|nr:hypothetical protein TRFO_40505 [Tritrichomonas foetus]|eukprot:OHS93218.1 hypothetical protein TRFO_40505 [Tritrichomonas foetus]